MRKAALVLLSVFLVTPAFADESTIATATTAQPTIGQSDLASVVATATKPDASAGTGRDVAAPIIGAPGATSERPAASPRMLRRMAVERTVKLIDGALHACTATTTTAKPGVGVLLRLSVSWAGEVENADVVGDGIPEAVTTCLRKVGRTAKFAPPGSIGATVLVPVMLATAAPPSIAIAKDAPPPTEIAKEAPPPPAATKPVAP